MHDARLPQLERLFLTDAGLETDMIYNKGLDLPCFSALTLMRTEQGRAALEGYFRDFLELAADAGTGCLLESATWRGSSDWAAPLGISVDQLDQLNRDAMAMLMDLRSQFDGSIEVVVSGCIGPRYDGYEPGSVMSYCEATAYHSRQVAILASTGPNMLSGFTMTNVNEAIGIARAAEKEALPVAISFTVETDGRLPTGDRLGDAIAEVDDVTAGYPAYYLVNCAHPSHFAEVLMDGEDWTKRVRGLRANASRCSHEELNAMTSLDAGDPAELAGLYLGLREHLPQLTVLGGCCGTDIRHITSIAKACAPAMQLA